MKKLFHFIVVAVIALAAISCAKQQNQIKVISYNVRCSGGDGENHWDKRKHASINMINEEKPTIFGLQEANPDQMQYMVENLPQYGHIGVGREDGVSRGEHMAIFYLKDEVELLDGGTFWLSETPDEPSKGWDAACKRSCTWTILRMKKTSTEFAYLNTHLDHIGQTARREGLALIVKRAEEIVPQGMTAFVTADFNAVTSSPIFEPLKADMLDAREVAPITDHRATYNGWRTDGINDANRVIDHIFFRGAEAESFRVLCDKNYGAPFISDHYPVVLEGKF